MKKTYLLFLCALLMLASCATKVPKDALTLSPTALADRQMQTRSFETTNFETMLSAASAVYQDLGFNLDEAEYKLGLLVGSKSRSAVNAGQVTGAIFLAILTGVATPVDKDQVIRASLVMRELEPGDSKKGKDGRSAVRITFQRMISDDHGQVTKLEGIKDSLIYQDFFDKLSQAVFLEAHEI
ncbi:hypothetical protein [Candidatus Desulfovibrio trichonymphae]|uniref:Lipoprotein n=1 Tax=Candidatus Desulfovibrio trichonymphae TaxID=1725232 RepID=A0A1J1DQE1_9BACT|nr:hypothetical protein [Candidatus Desulfovibrio trichonymphae]BAV92039.1 conserved hypothetical protein [Candidatus Desulfovibrio trichonymphae]GHU92445.1 hypothetical protein AGMMS49925_10800 [Deltaproteobacteria bacterium]GHU94476.1 hypothetical protein AGMMS49974_03980 [Deltaproteobacteria bacterium]GHU98472.1 hypothetical protein AGMMS50248_05100 [Deltaproteobacteria bacterium]